MQLDQHYQEQLGAMVLYDPTGIRPPTENKRHKSHKKDKKTRGVRDAENGRSANKWLRDGVGA
ncbi:hypothetical protein PG989_007770 [Apiospora arundinis]